jgi:outer membrane protein assembly factor BamB
VVLGMRDGTDRSDVFHCYAAKDGQLLWQVQYEAQGRLDYGNSPRATPLIKKDVVFLYGAFGDLRCVDLETGAVLWEKNVIDEFGSKVLTWGNCWSPILADGKLIVQPGAKDASIAALDPETGDVIWQTAGNPAAYSSPIIGNFSGTRQIICYDQTTLGGWDIKTGKRLWTLKPLEENDFNVPTPIQIGEKLFVTTENNGSRLFEFDKDGRIKSEAVAKFADLAPDTHTPVVVNDRIYGVSSDVFCLSATDLKQIWKAEDKLFEEYCAIVANQDRGLIITLSAELILFDARAEKFKQISRMNLSPVDRDEIYGHPAFVGKDAYFRVGNKLCKMSFSTEKN